MKTINNGNRRTVPLESGRRIIIQPGENDFPFNPKIERIRGKKKRFDCINYEKKVKPIVAKPKKKKKKKSKKKKSR